MVWTSEVADGEAVPSNEVLVTTEIEVLSMALVGVRPACLKAIPRAHLSASRRSVKFMGISVKRKK